MLSNSAQITPEYQLTLDWLTDAAVGSAAPIRAGQRISSSQRQEDWCCVASVSLERQKEVQTDAFGMAALVISPSGGNGINYAIADAVTAANLFSETLQRGRAVHSYCLSSGVLSWRLREIRFPSQSEA